MPADRALTARLRDHSYRSARPGQRVTGRQAVHRAVTVLSMFDERRRSLSVADVAAHLDVHRSTASRLLTELQNYGLVDHDERERCYRPGLGLVTLAGLALNRFPGRALGRSVLFDLRDQTGESAHLSVLDHSDVIYLEQASTVHAVIDTDWVGLRQPAFASTSGRLLLAFAPDRVAARPRSLAGEPPPGADWPTPEELAATRERGFLARTTPEEPGTGALAGVAAAVVDPRNGEVYALAVGGPVRRVSPRRLRADLVPAVQRAAARVAEKLRDSAR